MGSKAKRGWKRLTKAQRAVLQSAAESDRQAKQQAGRKRKDQPKGGQS